MDAAFYKTLVLFKKTGQLPRVFPSNKSNFLAVARKFTINAIDVLFRDGKIVAQAQDLEDIWESCHQHSGIQVTWEKIRCNVYTQFIGFIIFERDIGFMGEKSGYDRKLGSVFIVLRRTIKFGLQELRPSFLLRRSQSLSGVFTVAFVVLLKKPTNLS